MNVTPSLEQELYDIYGHWNVPFWQTKLFYMAILAVVFSFLALTLFVFIKKIAKQKKLSPEQTALASLLTLQKQSVKNSDDAQALYFSLTQILKEYFQKKYGIKFSAMTDQEMVENLPPSLQGEKKSKVEHIVSRSTQVKYARQEALQEEVKQDIALSVALIQSFVNNEQLQ